MKRTLNRILALGMAICMLLSLVVVQASAATTTDGLQSQISAAAGSSVQIVLDGDVTLDQTIQIPAKRPSPSRRTARRAPSSAAKG